MKYELIIYVLYSYPVINPVIHIDRLGGYVQHSSSSSNYYSNSALWTQTTSGLTLGQVSERIIVSK